jgi:hypothetical protein
MAVAAPARRSSAAAPAAPPAAPQQKKAAPAPKRRSKAAPKGRTAAPKGRTAAPKGRTAAPKSRAAAPRGRAATARASAAAAPAPARRAPARAPQRAKPKTRRSPGARVIPLAGRTAATVRHLPDSGLMVRMTRGRAWIGVLGVLLVGIVALNVVTLSFAASTGNLDQSISALSKENSILKIREVKKTSIGRTREAAAAQGMVMPPSSDTKFMEYDKGTVAAAAARLAVAGP